MVKIIQIVSTPEFGLVSEYRTDIGTTGEALYGLSIDGKLYKWGRAKIGMQDPKPDEIDEETGTKITAPYPIYGNGWILMEDEINK